MRCFIPALALLLSACWVEGDFEDYDLTVSAFSNPYVERGTATLQVALAEGYSCPDGNTARIYYVEPSQGAGPHPLAVLFHGRAFDHVDDQDEHYTDVNRLRSVWAGAEAEALLGFGTDSLGSQEGAWVAALLEQGYAVAVPTDCWGDLWHGRGGNDYGSEGFLRLGGYLASDIVDLARARDNVSTQRFIAVGLGEGGRAIPELIIHGISPDAVVIDSSPDWLAPVVSNVSLNPEYVDGLLKIWDDEVQGAADPDAQLELLRTALRRDSMVHAVEDLGYRAPIVYGWSPLDERIDPATSRPAADAIGANYGSAPHQILDWQVPDHAPSNRDIGQTRSIVEWIGVELGPVPPEPEEDPEAPVE